MMRSQWIIGILLVAMMGLATGASYGFANNSSSAPASTETSSGGRGRTQVKGKGVQAHPGPILLGGAEDAAGSLEGTNGNPQNYLKDYSPSQRKAEALRLARDWQLKGDLAMALHDPLVAYPYYEKIVELFPDTAHGWIAKTRLETARTKLLIPEKSPASDDPMSDEIYDFLTWP